MTNIDVACNPRGVVFPILALAFFLMASLVAIPAKAQTGAALAN